MIKFFYNKIVAAGFSFCTFIFLYAFIGKMNLFELSEELNNSLLWFAFYGYGIISSIVIDLMIKKWPTIDSKSLIIYCVFGFLPFLFFDSHIMFILIAGSVGVFATVLFYFGVKFVTKQRVAAIFFSMLLPLLLLLISTQDFTKKENWESTRLESSFEASFTYFNGVHKIPFELNKGDTLVFEIIFNTENGGGWGNHFENRKGDYLPMTESGEQLEFISEKADKYFIVVSGNRVKGKLLVEWAIE